MDQLINWICFFQFQKIVFVYFLTFGNTIFVDRYPDALACSDGFVLNVTATTVYFAHAGGMYCQVYGG